MEVKDIKLYQEELEELTGKIFSGDITPLFYEIVKDSPYKEKLFQSLGGKIEPIHKPVEIVRESFVSFDRLFEDSLEVR